MGYFGYSFFNENEDTLKALEIDGGSGCVAPSPETVQDGTYTPLARPLFVYPSAAALERPEFDAFLQYYLDNVNDDRRAGRLHRPDRRAALRVAEQPGGSDRRRWRRHDHRLATDGSR